MRDALHQYDAGGERGDHLIERQQRRWKREQADHDERDRRKAPARVQPCERCEEVAVARSRVRDARGGEQQTVRRAECRDEHGDGHRDRERHAERALRDERRDGGRAGDVLWR
ncbi:MAG TPA: hypothetical protein VGU66_19730 [Candidatus Elarobacter sp.]|nr:hypothetical protein [Candidatus Elarobacter sp.]